MVMLATMAATAWLFVIIPKGFFPEQDTGLMLGVTEAAQDISPDGMAAMQQKVIGTVLKDPAVASVGAYIGAGGATSTENQGRIFIALKPKSERPPITEVMARLGQAMQAVVGRAAVHAAGAGYRHRRPPDRDAVPVHADRHRPRAN